jgi:hypothetical protein
MMVMPFVFSTNQADQVAQHGYRGRGLLCFFVFFQQENADQAAQHVNRPQVANLLLALINNNPVLMQFMREVSRRDPQFDVPCGHAADLLCDQHFQRHTS